MRKKDLVKSSGDLSLVPAAAIKLAKQANREHQRATHGALRAIEHALKAGQALIKARELCEYGQWEEFIAVHFSGSMRTAQKYMRLARNWQTLLAENSAALSSQKQSVKALTAILAPDDAQGAQHKGAQGVRVSRKTRAGRGPVWRASGLFVREAMTVVSTLEASLSGLVARGYPLETEAEHVRAAVKRLQAMIDGEIDEAEALRTSGESTFVVEEAPHATSAEPRKEDDDGERR